MPDPRAGGGRGQPVGLGVDGSASNDSSNLMEGVRHALMLNRLTYDAHASPISTRCAGRPRARPPASAAPTSARSRSASRPTSRCFTLDELRFSGAGDPLAALVLCGAHRADRVMVAGRWRVEDGQPVGVDLARLRAEHGRAARRFLEETT